MLEGLKHTDKVWLIDLLQAFNEGNVMKFHQLRAQWENQPDLLSCYDKLLSKIQLLCLMEVFSPEYYYYYYLYCLSVGVSTTSKREKNRL